MAADEQPTSPDDLLVRQLRFLAAALRNGAIRFTRAQEASLEILVVTGWTIYQAAKDGVLGAILDLTRIDRGTELTAAMDKGTRKLLRGDGSVFGPLVIPPDPCKTIEEFLNYIETIDRGATQEQVSLTIDVSEPKPALNGDEDAVELVASCYRFLSWQERDRLPDDLAGSFFNNPYISDLFFASAAGFQKAAWVCDFLAEKIARRIASPSVGWVTISHAAILTGINKGELSRKCKASESGDPELETNGEDGQALRIWVPSLVGLMKLRQAIEGEQSATSKLKRGVECSRCDEPYPDRPDKCKKCGSTSFRQARLDV
jgi:hypothetical protein